MIGKASFREKVVQKGCLDFLALLGIKAWRTNAGMMKVVQGGVPYMIRLAPKGTPDIIGYLPDGRFLGVEVKRQGGRRRPEQSRFIEELNQSGGLGLIVESVTELETGLRAAGILHKDPGGALKRSGPSSSRSFEKAESIPPADRAET